MLDLPDIVANKLSPISSLVTADWYFVVEIGTRQGITRFAVRNTNFKAHQDGHWPII